MLTPRNKYEEIATKNNWKHFVENMYTEHQIVFINQDDLDAHCEFTNQIINEAKTTLMCGDTARDKIKEIIKSENSKTKVFHSNHPSPRIDVNDERKINIWIFIKTKETFDSTKRLEYQHSVKKDFMIC